MNQSPRPSLIRRNRIVLRRRAVATGTAVLLGLASSACGGDGATSSATPEPTTHSTTSATTQVTEPQVTASTTADGAGPTAPEPVDIEDAGGVRFDVAGEPDWVTLADGNVFSWTTGVGRFDAATGVLLGTTDIGTASICLAMDAGFGSVWVGLCGTPSLMRLDPATGDVQATISLPVSDLHEESSLAAGEGGVFAVASSEDQIVKVDPSTNTVAATFDVAPGATAIRAGFGSLWVTYRESDEVVRLDPVTGEVIATTRVGAGPRFLAVGDEGVWVMNQGDGSVSRIDPETNAVIANVQVNDGPISFGDIAVGGGSAWVRPTDHLLVRVDASTNQITGVYDPPSGSGGVDADSEAVWLSAHDVDAMWRLPLSP